MHRPSCAAGKGLWRNLVKCIWCDTSSLARTPPVLYCHVSLQHVCQCETELLLRQHMPQSNDPAVSALHRPVARSGAIPAGSGTNLSLMRWKDTELGLNQVKEWQDGG